MSVKVIFVIITAIVASVVGYIMANKIFTDYFNSRDQLKDTIMIEQLKDKFVNRVAVLPKNDLKSLLNDYLNSPSAFDVEAVFTMEMSDIGDYSSVYKDDLLSEQIDSQVKDIINDAVESNETGTNSIMDKYVVKYYIKRASDQHDVAIAVGVVIDNEWSKSEEFKASLLIGATILGIILVISFFISIVFSAILSKDKAIFSSFIDEVVQKKSVKVTFITPFKEEIGKISNMVEQSNMLSKKNDDLEKRNATLEKQSHDLIAKLDKTTRDIGDLKAEKERQESEFQALVLLLTEFTETQRDRFWHIQQLIDRIMNEGIGEISSLFSNTSIIERDVEHILKMTGTLVLKESKKDTLHTVIAQSENRFQELKSITDLYFIDSKVSDLMEKVVAADQKVEQFEHKYNKLYDLFDSINQDAFKNRLTISQNYKSFMEQISGIRQKLDSRQTIVIDDIDSLHRSYRVALGSYRQFIDEILTHGRDSEDFFKKENISISKIKDLVEGVINDVSNTKKEFAEKSEAVKVLMDEGLETVKFLIDLHYRYLDNVNTSRLSEVVNNLKQTFYLLRKINDNSAILSSHVEKSMTKLDDINRFLY